MFEFEVIVKHFYLFFGQDRRRLWCADETLGRGMGLKGTANVAFARGRLEMNLCEGALRR